MIYLERGFWHDPHLTHPPPYTEDGSLILESLRRRLECCGQDHSCHPVGQRPIHYHAAVSPLTGQRQQVETQVKTLDEEMQRLKVR